MAMAMAMAMIIILGSSYSYFTGPAFEATSNSNASPYRN